MDAAVFPPEFDQVGGYQKMAMRTKVLSDGAASGRRKAATDFGLLGLALGLARTGRRSGCWLAKQGIRSRRWRTFGRGHGGGTIPDLGSSFLPLSGSRGGVARSFSHPRGDLRGDRRGVRRGSGLGDGRPSGQDSVSPGRDWREHFWGPSSMRPQAHYCFPCSAWTNPFRRSGSRASCCTWPSLLARGRSPVWLWEGPGTRPQPQRHRTDGCPRDSASWPVGFVFEETGDESGYGGAPTSKPNLVVDHGLFDHPGSCCLGSMVLGEATTSRVPLFGALCLRSRRLDPVIRPCSRTLEGVSGRSRGERAWRLGPPRGRIGTSRRSQPTRGSICRR